MVLRIFAVRDQKVEAFMPPYTARTRGEGIRLFSDAVNNPESPFSKHPEDYFLFELGEVDMGSGEVRAVEGEGTVSLGNALQFRQEPPEAGLRRMA